MRLSWNEIRIRADAFAKEWAGRGYERKHTHSFYHGFFGIFGMPIGKVASFEEPVKLLGNKRGYMDLFWKGVLLVEQKSMDRSLEEAKVQALEYLSGLKNSECPRYMLLSNFQSFELYDFEDDSKIFFPLEELPQHVERFGFILGVQKREFREQDPVNIQASEIVGELHNALSSAKYTGHDLEQFLVRIVFCLFADDTGVFEFRGMFHDLIEQRTSEDGFGLGSLLVQLFEVLNTPEDQREGNLDSDLAAFCYVDGDLFKDRLKIPSFDSKMRRLLLQACQFDWSRISPAIFGSLFQFVMDGEERRRQGAHYTTEKNIMKVIEPLFLTELKLEYERIGKRKDTHRRSELMKFQKRLSGMRFFDPACGCGNFLVIAYRELRLLELELIRDIRHHDRGQSQLELDATKLSLINVDQFYGIEISEFPVRIAETALWMMDHIMNNLLSLEFGQSYVRIPLKNSPQIKHGDALEMDWEEVLVAEECTCLLGNPPFRGAKLQSSAQKEQVRKLAKLGKSGGTLDYVAAWLIKAGEYIGNGKTRIGFVATNSITQGEQVAQLWPVLFDRLNLEISFAHRSFEWESEARGRAHVHVVILGLTSQEHAPKRKLLYSYESLQGDPHESSHVQLSPYLIDASGLENPRVVVREVSKPLNGLPKIISGSQPIDGGHYIFSTQEKGLFLKSEPKARKFFRPYLGGQEFLQGGGRWILALQNATPDELANLPMVRKRIEMVKEDRAKSGRKETRRLAEFPLQYCVNVLPTSPFLVIPEVSSQRREYIPIGWLNPPVVPSNKIRLLENATYVHFALLTSSMHMCWLRNIGGKLEVRLSYGIGVVYNTFPIPKMTESKMQGIEPLAQDILRIRDSFGKSTLSELYDPAIMPAELRKAHQKLDRAVDRLYSKKVFLSEHQRCEHLLSMYEKMSDGSQLHSK